jgi:hypothetical protein
LFDDDDGVVELLPLQERMHVARENGQVSTPISHGDDNGDFVTGPAFARLVSTASRDTTLNHLVLYNVFILFENGWDRYVDPSD